MSTIILRTRAYINTRLYVKLIIKYTGGPWVITRKFEWTGTFNTSTPPDYGPPYTCNCVGYRGVKINERNIVDEIFYYTILLYK